MNISKLIQKMKSKLTMGKKILPSQILIFVDKINILNYTNNCYDIEHMLKHIYFCMNEEQIMQQRNRMVDILKGIGILLVILTHYAWNDIERLRLLFPYIVDPAISIFMIISGYVYSMSYQRVNIDTIGKAYNFRFISDKIIRYTVPFLIAYLICFLQ